MTKVGIGAERRKWLKQCSLFFSEGLDPGAPPGAVHFVLCLLLHSQMDSVRTQPFPSLTWGRAIDDCPGPGQGGARCLPTTGPEPFSWGGCPPLPRGRWLRLPPAVSPIARPPRWPPPASVSELLVNLNKKGREGAPSPCMPPPSPTPCNITVSSVRMCCYLKPRPLCPLPPNSPGNTFLDLALWPLLSSWRSPPSQALQGVLCTHQPGTRNQLCPQISGNLAPERPSDGNGNRKFHSRKNPIPFY